MLGSPIPILAISRNIIVWFIDHPGLKIVKSLNINIVGFLSFGFGYGLDYVTSSSLNCCKDRSLFL